MSNWNLWSPIVVGLAMSAIVVLVGIAAVRSNKTLVAITCESIGRAFACFAFCVGLYALVPKHKAIFLGFGTELPGITQILFGISDSVVSHPIRFITLLIIAFVTDVVVMYLLHRNEETRSAAKWLSGAITALSAVGISFCVFAIFVPLIKILNDLS